MSIELADRIHRIKPSPTLAVSARAAALKAEGKDIISLGAGEPDFDTPYHIQEAAIDAIQNGFTRYTPVDGLPSVKEAVIEKFKRDNNLKYTPNQVIISTGCKQSIYNLLQVTLNPGDEAIIPAPYWVSYPDMVLLAEGKPVTISTSIENQYKITPEQLKAAITNKTRFLFLNSPSNPTGVAYTHAELRALGEVLKKHPNIIIATDDIYEYFQWNGEKFANIVMLCPELYDQTVVLNGVSKSYAMTGWRIGYAAGPEHIIKAMKKIQSQCTSNPCSISQKAAEAAILGDQSCVQTMLNAFKDRHDKIYARLKSFPHTRVTPSDGTFYIFPNVQGVIDNMPNIVDDVALSEHLLVAAGVALVPGSAFGAPGCIRISFATSQQILDEALDRILNVFNI